MWSLIFFLLQAHAQSCPLIEGEFNCAGHGLNYKIQVQTDEVDGSPRYTFAGSAEGQTQFVANGQEQPITTGREKGIMYGNCENERLIVSFALTNDKGEAEQFRDEMYMERKALVRIRFENGRTSVFVCRPVYRRPS